MPLEINLLIPFLSFATVSLILLSDHKKIFSFVGLGFLVSYLIADTFWGWDSLKDFSSTLFSYGPESLSVFISFALLILMTSLRRTLDLTLCFFGILPLLFVLVFNGDIFMFTVSASLVLSIIYYQVSKGLSGALLSVVTRIAYMELFLIFVFGLVSLFSEGLTTLGVQVNFPLLVSCFFAFLYLLLQGPLNVKLYRDGLSTNKLLVLSIPKSIICLQLIYIGHELFEKLSVTYQLGLTDFIYYVQFVILGFLTFLSIAQKSRENYSRIYVVSLFSTIASLVVFGIPLDNKLLLSILLLDTAISFSALANMRNHSITGMAFTLQTTLLPISIVFFSKLILVRYIIVESDYNVFSYLVLINQVCLSVAAIKLCSTMKIGKINLSVRHAVYLSCVILSACLMVILP
jgi:hypothetical protein